MKEKKIKIFGAEYKYTEHKGMIQFPALLYIKMLDRDKKGDPTLEVIYQFGKMGYDFISESTFNMYFKKRSKQ